MAKPAGTWTDWAAYICVRCLICAVQTITLESCDRICKVLASIIANHTRIRRQVTDDNLKLVYGESISDAHMAELRRRMWHHLLLMICEIAHTPRKIHRTNWHEHFYMPNKSAMLSKMMDPSATVLVTGHYGNFEVAGHLVGLVGAPTSTMARPLDNPYIDDYLTKFRASDGQHILPKDGSANAVQDLLEAGGTLAILADQHAGTKGTWVEFFGHPTSCHKGLALFVLSSKAPMVVNYNRRLDRPLRFEMGCTGVADPELEKSDAPPEYLNSVTDLTEWYNGRLEDAIRKSPEQYWWLHRRWRGVPPNQLKRIAARKAKKEKAKQAA